MATDPKKAARISEVQELLDAFAQKHLTPELAGYVRRLWEQIGRKRNYIITGGKPEIWASAVLWVCHVSGLKSNRVWPALRKRPTDCILQVIRLA